MAGDESRVIRLRIRGHVEGEIAIGPGKADLLELIHDSGSISQAAREMDMSYRRAWALVQTMNAAFRGAVVEGSIGGKGGGGACVTPLGQKVLKQYRAAEKAAYAAAGRHIAAIHKELEPARRGKPK